MLCVILGISPVFAYYAHFRDVEAEAQNLEQLT